MLRAAPDGSPLRLALRAHLRDDPSSRLIPHSRIVNALPGSRPNACAATSRTAENEVTRLTIELDVLTPAERRDLANALLRAAWSAALEETRIVLLDLSVDVDALPNGDSVR